MKKLFARIICFAVALVLAFSPVLTSLAATARVIEDNDELILFTESFNTAVNAIKTDLPYAVLTNKSGVPEDGIVSGSDGNTEALDEEVSKYLIPVLDGLFKNNSSVAKSFIATLLGDDTVISFDKIELHRGALRNSLVPIYGEDYVSSLVPADDYQITVFENETTREPEELLITLAGGIDLSAAENTSYSRLFSLPSGTIDPVILSGTNSEGTELLRDVTFTEFKLGKAAVRIELDEDGKVSRYRSQIDYVFKLSFYDLMKILTAVLKFDFLETGVSLANTILINLGKEGVSAEDILKEREMSITYTSAIEINDFNWNQRYFGDINDDGEVKADDARLALRHAVELNFIKNSSDQIYADVDFDGDITSADARLILRMSVGLDPLFNEVPDGETIKIAIVEEDPEELPDEDDTQEEDPSVDDPAIELPDLSFLQDMPSDVAQMVFDAIEGFSGMSSDVRLGITEWINAIKNLVTIARN